LHSSELHLSELLGSKLPQQRVLLLLLLLYL
jgi:hypothetical protein